MSLKPETDRRASAVGCDVVAQAVVRATPDEIPALRRSPGTLGRVAFPPSLLRHADEQSVVGLVAVLRAVQECGLDPLGFADWGVVAAPRFLGRSAFDAAFPQFLAEGAWGVSPLLISSHSLHAVSGMVSQAIQAHGPNLGVGGTPGGETEALLTAAVLLDGGTVPGVWVVLTGWSPDWDGTGKAAPPGVCEALSLALTAARPGWTGPRLRVAPGEVRVEPTTGSLDATDGPTRGRLHVGPTLADAARGSSADRIGRAPSSQTRENSS